MKSDCLMPNVVARQAQVLSSTLVSTLDLWRGTMLLQATPQPKRPISLYDLEGDKDCRQMREALTALGLDVVVRCLPAIRRTPSAGLEDCRAVYSAHRGSG
jgi:hypothetical protein